MAFASGIPMVVPDLLYEKELEPYNGAYYRALGLQVVALQPDEVSFAQLVKNERKPLSLPDCFALSCARRQDHVLLTGDGPLRTTAKDYGVEMYGLLWLLDRLAESGAATYSTLHEGLTKISPDRPASRSSRNNVAILLIAAYGYCMRARSQFVINC